MQIIKILIADDHKLVRTGLISILNQLSNCKVIGEACNGIELVKKYFELEPDVILVDINMPGKSGLEAVKEIGNKDKEVKALFLSIYTSETDVYQVFKAGGLGLVGKEITAEELEAALQKVYNEELAFGANWNIVKLRQLLSKYGDTVYSVFDDIAKLLSDRQLEIFKDIGHGMDNEKICDKYSIGLKTVQTYRRRIMIKLNLESNDELLRISAEFAHRALK